MLSLVVHWIWLVTALALCGCEEPQIKKYTIPREKSTPDYTRLESYRLPEGWTRLAKSVSPSIATFTPGGDDQKAKITINRFAGTGGGLNFNIERWRKNVGLPPATEEQNRNELLWLNVAGEKTPYADLSNPKNSDGGRILGVVAQRGPVTWFFTMQGPPDQVGRQKAAFEAFVESVKFGGMGANDG